ncbi:MAG TPA: hypothetical protein DHU96_21950, partial [Actinobacteria bacterium]|nr:hypothetical protein [Actinomycetota bacterium]
MARLAAGLAVLAVIFAAGAYLYVHVAGRLFGRPGHLPAPLLLALALTGGAASFFSPCSIAITPSFIGYLASTGKDGSRGPRGRLLGPAALVAAGIGSWYASITKCNDHERRLFLLIGMAAGLAAIFRSPVGTAIFAIEVLYGAMEFESDALLYTLLASIVAYAVNGFFSGWTPLFDVPAQLRLGSPLANGWFVVLGIAAGVVAPLLPNVFYGIRDFFHKLRMPSYFKPALGGLGMGLLALAVPQVLGGGYGWIQLAIDGPLALATLIALSLAKILALSLAAAAAAS